MSVQIGSRLGPYEIVAKLGEGGMGEVYRGRDTQLGRDVAIKVLPSAFAADADRVARFKREAQVLASLNHPNIAAIYGIETNALVMELVEGVDLTGAIRSGRFAGPDGIAEARQVAAQVASALEAAHEAGIVHRDLKPANIKLRPDGTVKVLDFGLAKSMGTDPSSGADLLNSPTMTTPAMTTAGVIMGTAAYMSPEQSRGRPVDRRADIWAFGCVLSEMLTGKTVFGRESLTDILAAITRDEPDWASHKTLPVDLTRLLKRCLDKDPRTRLRDIGEARVTLSTPERTDLDAAGTAALPLAAPTRRAAPVTWMAIALVLAAASSAATWWALTRGPWRPRSTSLASISRITTDAGLTTSPAVAANGSLLAYASDRLGGSLNIFVQPLPDGSPVQVTHDAVDASEPSFSADGSRIAYRSERDGGGIYVVPALGGTPRFIVAKGRTPRFSPTANLIAYHTGGRGSNSELWVIDADGGSPRRIAADLTSVSQPVWSPDGRFILSEGQRESGTTTVMDWWLVDPEGGASLPMGAVDVLKPLNMTGTPSAWIGDRIVFLHYSERLSSLWTIDVASAGRHVTGAPRRVTASAGSDVTPTAVAAGDGLMIFYANVDYRANIYRLPATGDLSAVPERVTDAAAADNWPSVSSDGKTLAFGSTRGGQSVWVRDLMSGRETQLSTAEGGALPTISPDGQRVVFNVGDRGAKRRIVIRSVGGGALEDVPDLVYAWSWPTNDRIIGGRRPGNINETVWVNAATREIRPALAGLKQGFFGHGQLSPDGRWASLMEFSGADQARLVVYPLRDTPSTPADLIALTGDRTVEEEHAWSPRSDAIYFASERDGTRCFWKRRWDPVAGKPVGVVEPVLHLHGARRSMITTADSPQRIALQGGYLYFSMQEQRANIWKATLK